MDTHGRESDDATTQALSQEIEVVRGAIEMVASGAARRVIVASLRFGDELLAPVRLMASDRGTEVRPSWSADERVTSIAFERTER